ncbi:CGNR zinc finger domain-containing protein [Nocardioides sp. AN3]
MVFAHDTEMALQAAVALVNAPGTSAVLGSVEDLAAFFDRHGYTGRHDRTQAELEDLRALRPRLRVLLTADLETAVGLVNELLAEHRAVPRLVRHPPLDWHIHAAPDDAPLATRVAVETAMAMVDVIREGELSRLSTCADEDCEDLVLDLSRNRSKRFCSTACGNRNAVAAYRARQATH